MLALKNSLPSLSLGEQKVRSIGSLTEGAKPSKEKIETAAEDFEALLLQQMFAAMWSSVPEGGVLGGGSEGEFYRDLLNQQLAKEVAHSQSIGLKKTFAEDMARVEGTGDSVRRDLGIG